MLINPWNYFCSTKMCSCYVMTNITLYNQLLEKTCEADIFRKLHQFRFFWFINEALFGQLSLYLSWKPTTGLLILMIIDSHFKLLYLSEMLEVHACKTIKKLGKSYKYSNFPYVVLHSYKRTDLRRQKKYPDFWSTSSLLAEAYKYCPLILK